MDYCTLRQVRDYRGFKETETGDDARLQTFIRGACGFIDRYCQRRFDVRRETRRFNYPLKPRSAFGVYDAASFFVDQMNAVGDLGAGVLRVDDDLLAVESILNGDGSLIDPEAYVLEPSNVPVKHSIRLLTSSGLRWLPGANGRREQVIGVTGPWGYHDRYDAAWIDSLDTVRDNSLSAAATTLTVSDADGVSEDLQTPRFQTGQLLKIDDEFVTAIAVNATTNLLTVKRGANGTTAAGHAQDTPIYIYRPMENIVTAAIRLTIWRYTQKDNNTFDKTTILGTGVAITPSAVPKDVLALLPAPKPTGL